MGNPRNVVPENGARSPLNKILWEHIRDPLIVSTGKKLTWACWVDVKFGDYVSSPWPLSYNCLFLEG